MSDLTIVWFKGDLRLDGTVALAQGCARGPVALCFIRLPRRWAQPCVLGRLFDCQCDSAADTRQLGSDF